MKTNNTPNVVFMILVVFSFTFMIFHQYFSAFGVTSFTFLLSPTEKNEDVYDKKHEIRRLSNIVQQLNLKIKNLEDTLSNVKALQQIPYEEPHKIIEARILLRRDSSDNRNSFVINRGSKDGVGLKFIVTYKEYLLGIVYKVSPYSSMVMQVSDPKMKIAVLLTSENREVHDTGISVGQSEQYCKLNLIEWQKIELLSKGKAITSGEQEMFPQGFIVGDVKVEKQENDTYRLTVHPMPLREVSNVVISKFDRKR